MFRRNGWTPVKPSSSQSGHLAHALLCTARSTSHNTAKQQWARFGESQLFPKQTKFLENLTQWMTGFSPLKPVTLEICFFPAAPALS
jgi:hypothetical protein